MKRLLFTSLLLLFIPSTALAGDKATLVFESGLVVTINDGFRQVVEAMKRLNNNSQDHKVVELEIGGGSFLLNVAEVVVACRDECNTLEIIDKRDTARSGNNNR